MRDSWNFSQRWYLRGSSFKKWQAHGRPGSVSEAACFWRFLPSPPPPLSPLPSPLPELGSSSSLPPLPPPCCFLFDFGPLGGESEFAAVTASVPPPAPAPSPSQGLRWANEVRVMDCRICRLVRNGRSSAFTRRARASMLECATSAVDLAIVSRFPWRSAKLLASIPRLLFASAFAAGGCLQ